MDGYTYEGWNKAVVGSDMKYVDGTAFNMGSANVTLYAKWGTISAKTVTYDGNDNSSVTVSVDNNHYIQGEHVINITYLYAESSITIRKRIIR